MDPVARNPGRLGALILPFRRTATKVLLIAALQQLVVNGAHPSPQDHDSPGSARIMQGWLIIKLKENPAAPTGYHAQSAPFPKLSEYGVRSVQPMFEGLRYAAPGARKALSSASALEALSRIHIAAIPLDLDPATVAADIARLPEVEYAEPRYLYPVLAVPNDSLLAFQISYLQRMHAFEGWSITRGDSSVVIATVDGGTFWRHEDLQPNLWINRGEDINHNGRYDRGAPPARSQTSFRLEQNFPNPFNSATTIRYSLPRRSFVDLVVYNILGQEVAGLVHGDVEAGDHEVQFNAVNLASGVYFYRLQAGGMVQTMRLCVLN